MSDSYDDFSSNSPDITAQNWVSHFKQLHAKHNLGTEQENILQQLDMLKNNKKENNFLDNPISESDILNAPRNQKTENQHTQIR